MMLRRKIGVHILITLLGLLSFSSLVLITEEASGDTPPAPISITSTDCNETGVCGSLEDEPFALPDIVVRSDEIEFFYAAPWIGCGEEVTIRSTVRNVGGALAENFSVVTFIDDDGDMSPIPSEVLNTVHIGSLAVSGWQYVAVNWTPVTPGIYTVCAQADPSQNVTESDEANNTGCKDIEVLGPDFLTTLVVGQPNYTVDNTFITSATPLSFQAVELTGGQVDYTEYRIDAGNWMLYSQPFTIPDEGFHGVEYRSSDLYGNFEPTRFSVLGVDNTPPSSDISIGEPSYIKQETWIKSETPLTIPSLEPLLNLSVTTELESIGIYQEVLPVGNETWEEFMARVNYSYSRTIWPGLESVTFHISNAICPDLDLGVFYDANGDNVRQPEELIAYDADADADEMVILDNPLAGPYIIAIAGFTVIGPGPCTVDLNIISTFGGSASSGLFGTEYRVWSGGQWSDWSEYTTPFTIPNEGLAFVEHQAFDNLGNTEPIQNTTLHVDDTPPESSAVKVERPEGGYYVLIQYSDAGCGVDRTHYRIVAGFWENSSSLEANLSFINPGNFTVQYYAEDHLGNVEAVKSIDLGIPLEDTGDETETTEYNWKPLVATIFALVLLVTGIWVSRRAPWKGFRNPKSTLIAFAIFSFPFVLVEMATGILSLITGMLSIPPIAGPGTFVDLGILIFGTIVVVLRAWRQVPTVDEVEETEA